MRRARKPKRGYSIKLKRGDRGILALGFVSFFMDAASDMIYSILPIFITSVIGAPVAAVGLIEGIADSASSILQTVSGWWSDKIRRRRPFVLAGYSMSTIVKPLIGLSAIWQHVLVLKFLDRVGKGIRNAPRDAMVAEHGIRNRGRAFGIQRALDNAGAIAGTLITFVLLFYGISMRSIFLLAAIPAATSVLLIIFFVKEGKGRGSIKKIRFSVGSFGMKYKLFLAASVIFGVANFSYAFFILRAQELGIVLALIPIIYMLYSLTASVSSMPVGKYSDRIGKKGVMLMGWIGFSVVCTGFMIANSPLHAWLLFAAYGLFFAIQDTISRAYVADMVPLKYEGTALGVYHTTIGLTALPASLIAGLVWDMFGSQVLFMYAASLALIAAFFLLVIPSSTG